MPDTRTHRGAHPEDDRLFAAARWPCLRSACHDLSWLLTRGYASASALKLVGDRFELTQRQRLGVSRCAASDQACQRCRQGEVDLAQLPNDELWIDGYNVLTSVEAALAGGVILKARDGCLRDMASMHGSWRKVAETQPALGIIARFLARQRPGHCCWFLDRPVSNSGRLKALILHEAAAAGWDWSVRLVANPDKPLSDAIQIVASSDREILVRCGRWLNLARHVIEQELTDIWLVDLSTFE